MAVPDEQGVSSFPNPPTMFYKKYTDENVKAGLAPKPPAPVQGTYHMFGAPFDINDAMIRPLEDQSIDRLYPQRYDRKAELKKLNHSILVCFLELLDILINNPASPARTQKLTDLSVLFINMHHLINEYRPHQARETLRVIMERQKRLREEIISYIQRSTDRAKSLLKDCSDSLDQVLASLQALKALTREEEEEGGPGEEEAMDTTSALVTKGTGTLGGTKESWMSQDTGKMEETAQLSVDKHNAQLCTFIDSLMP